MTGKPLTDAEVLAIFMEPTSIVGRRVCYEGDQDGTIREVYVSAHRWWEADTEDRVFRPVDITLDACHEIEARLTDEQWGEYEITLNAYCNDWTTGKPHWWAIHATAEQKTCALAAVLRPLVEGVTDAQKEQQNA